MSMNTMTLTQSVSLIGLMGAGKSAIGRALSTQLGCAFADSDAEIVAEAGLTIGEIFDLAGETKFREMELRAVRKLLDGPPVILSTGGGAFCQPDTQSAIMSQSASLWIYAPPATLLDRMSKPLKRPLLQVADPLAVMQELAQKRQSDYAKATIHVDTDGCSLRQAVSLVFDALQNAGIITSHAAHKTL